MLKKIVLWLVPVLALIGGAVAGDFLAPKPEASTAEAGDHASIDQADKTADGHEPAGADTSDHVSGGAGAGEHGSGSHGSGEGENAAAWFTFPNQFFVPLVRGGAIESMMVLTLTIETSEADMPSIETQEHRLRDALLRSLIIHANTGGFTGNFTAEAKLERLRTSLYAAAVKASGPKVRAVLIEDIGQAGS